MLQKMMLNLFRTAFKLVEIILPPVAQKWAIHLFFKPRRYRRPEIEQRLIADVGRREIPFKSNFGLKQSGDSYITYSWGNGPVILLVHGWEGRGSQMAHFAKRLAEAGYRIITFDAPAHGDAPGRQTNLPEIAQVIRNIGETTGGFHAVIGHSLGGVAAAYALNEGVKSERLVTISSPAAIEFILTTYARQINASRKTIDRLAGFIEYFSGRNIDDFSLKNIVARLPQTGLIIHDKNDKEIPYDQAFLLSQNWRDSRLIFTRSLGHRRILRDERTIREVINFINLYREETVLNYTN